MDVKVTGSVEAMNELLTIIIPTKNRKDILKSSLEYLSVSGVSSNVEVIVVNDGSENLDDLGTREFRVNIVKNMKSGVASARNTGALYANGDILMFMDDDMWITKEAIERVISFHRQRDNVVLNLNWIYPPELQARLRETAFGRYLDHFGFTSLKGWSKTSAWNDHELFHANGVTSQNLSMRKSTFIRSGGYDETFPLAGFEDHAYAIALKESNISIFVDPLVMTFHNESDRVDIKPWLERKVRGSLTRRVAVQKGFKELSIHYSVVKKIILELILKLQPFFITVITSPVARRNTFLDFASFRMTNALLAASIYKGYHKMKEIK